MDLNVCKNPASYTGFRAKVVNPRFLGLCRLGHTPGKFKPPQAQLRENPKVRVTDPEAQEEKWDCKGQERRECVSQGGRVAACLEGGWCNILGFCKWRVCICGYACLEYRAFGANCYNVTRNLTYLTIAGCLSKISRAFAIHLLTYIYIRKPCTLW